MDDRQAVISASLGGIDKPVVHVSQTLKADYFHFTDKNFPPRDKALTPRLQAKIPKMFGWQLKPGYGYYLWVDGNISFSRPDTLQFFYDQIQGYDMVVLKHHRRPNIRQEVRYLRKGIREQSTYLVSRYNGEWWQEQYSEIQRDKSYQDNLLAIGGIFMYRNTPQVQAALKEWWYQNTRYCIQDQISFAYVLRDLKVKALEIDYTHWDYIKHVGHNIR